MRKFLVLLALAVAFGFFLLDPEEESEGLVLAEMVTEAGVELILHLWGADALLEG